MECRSRTERAARVGEREDLKAPNRTAWVSGQMSRLADKGFTASGWRVYESYTTRPSGRPGAFPAGGVADCSRGSHLTRLRLTFAGSRPSITPLIVSPWTVRRPVMLVGRMIRI